MFKPHHKLYIGSKLHIYCIEYAPYAARISGVVGILPDELFHAMRDSEAEQHLEPSLLMTIVLSSDRDPFSIFLFPDFLAGRTLRSSVLWNSKIWRHHSTFLITTTKLMKLHQQSTCQGQLKTAKTKADSVQRPVWTESDLCMRLQSAGPCVPDFQSALVKKVIDLRQLEDAKNDIANVEQKIADVAAEEALVQSSENAARVS